VMPAAPLPAPAPARPAPLASGAAVTPQLGSHAVSAQAPTAKTVSMTAQGETQGDVPSAPRPVPAAPQSASNLAPPSSMTSPSASKIKTAPMSAVVEPKAKTPIVLLIGVAVACLLAGVLLTVVVLKFLG
jgi:hypothetical protein